MGATHWEEVKKRFEEALQLKGSERESLLASVRLASPAVFDEVVRLLAGYQQLESSAQTFILNRDLHTEIPFFPTLVRTFEPGEMIADRYEVKRFIATGGMGVVYEVDDRELGERVALKTLRPEFASDPATIELFRREIRLSRRVADNSHVCHVFDVGWHRLAGEPLSGGQKGLMFLTMELLAGETLADRLKRETKIPPSEALSLARQMADGLTALHKVHVIHRDFKPSNVMLVPAGDGSRRVVVTDFGLARTIPRKEGGQTEEESVGPPRFTRDYVAPEQLTAEQVSPASDVFSFGVTLFEMVTGKRPFDAANDIATLIRRFSDPPSPKEHEPDLDHRWEQTILKCLRRQPGERYQSPRDVVRALEGEQVEENRPAISGWVKAALAAAASLLIAGLVWQIPSVRNTALDQACQWFPGSALACRLPADKDLAVLPFENLSEGEGNRAFAAGLIGHAMSGLSRLAPEKDSTCVHIRDDFNAFGVRLVLTGSVRRTEERVHVLIKVSDAETRHLLREIAWEAPIADATMLHAGLLRKLTDALEMKIPDRDWEVWQAEGTSDGRAFEAYLQGLGHLAHQEYEDAVNSFRIAVNDFPFALAHAGLGNAFRLRYDQTGELKWARSAENAFREAEGLSDHLPQTFYGLGQLAASLDNYKEAARRFSQALELEEYDFDAQRGLAAAYEALGQREEADRVNQRNVQLRPSCWYVYNHLGLFYAERGDYELATKHLLKLVQLTPRNGTAYSNLAWVYQTQGRYPDAMATARKAIELGVGAFAYMNLGRSYYAEGCYEQAVEALETAAELEPENYRALGLLAEIYQLRPERKDDVARLNARTIMLAEREAVRQPRDIRPRQYLALSLARTGETLRAQTVIERALAMAPGRGRTLFFAALVYEISGERQKALAALESALRGRYPVFEIRREPELAALRKTREYHALEQQLGLNELRDAGATSGSAETFPCASAAQFHKISEPGRGRE